MRFLTGLLIGLAIGFVAAILFAPEKQKRHEEHLWQAPPEEEPEEAEAAAENHDFLASLRRTMRSLQEQAEEAWSEAVKAADEAEKEMRARYQRMARRAR